MSISKEEFIEIREIFSDQIGKLEDKVKFIEKKIDILTFKKDQNKELLEDILYKMNKFEDDEMLTPEEINRLMDVGSDIDGNESGE